MLKKKKEVDLIFTSKHAILNSCGALLITANSSENGKDHGVISFEKMWIA